jgi:hypothetical protein
MATGQETPCPQPFFTTRQWTRIIEGEAGVTHMHYRVQR